MCGCVHVSSRVGSKLQTRNACRIALGQAEPVAHLNSWIAWIGRNFVAQRQAEIVDWHTLFLLEIMRWIVNVPPKGVNRARSQQTTDFHVGGTSISAYVRRA